MKRFTERNRNGKAICRANPYITPFVNETEVVCGETIERLAELEDKLESGLLLELPTIISFLDTHPFFGKITAYQVVWLDELLGIRHEKYTTREQAEVRLRELREKL